MFPPVRITRRWIPGGDLGAMVTVGEMRRLAYAPLKWAWLKGRLARVVSDPLTCALARSIVVAAPGDTGAQVEALRTWLASRVRFRRDPRGVELLVDPRVMLRRLSQGQAEIRGDCDEVAILGAAIAKAMGHRTRFRVLAFGSPNAPFRHVVADVLTPLGWRDLDVTRRYQAFPPVVSRTYTVAV